MRSAVLGWVLGACLLQMQPALPSFGVMVCCVAASVLCWAILRHRVPSVGSMVAIALLGFAWAAAVAHWTLRHELPLALEGQDVTLIGTVASLPDTIDRGTRFTFDVERVATPEPATIPPRIVLSWYADQRRGDAQEPPSVQAGERWQLTVRMRRPHGNANPDGFDYEAWLLEQGIRATGTVRNGSAANQRIAEFVPGMHSAVERARGWLRDRIFAALPERPYAGVIVALVIGDQRGVSQSDWQVFNRTGIGHLVSISGLHITMIAGMAAALIGALWRRSFFVWNDLPLRLPAQKATALAGALTAFVYVLLAGFGVPAQRTLYMLCVVAFALWSGRMASVSHILCAALAVVVLLDPWAVLWPGFWLSFGAVATILYASVGRAGEFARANTDWRARAWNTLRAGTHTQYVVTVGLVPLTILLFGQISLVSPVANALAIPLISCLVTPLALAGSVAPAPLIGWLLGLAHWLVEQLAVLLSWLSALPHAVWSAPLPAWWMFACASLGMLWLLAPRGWPVRWLGLIGVVPLVLNVPTHPKAGQVWVTALDVGQGNALLVETASHRLLYDTGPALSPQSDAGSRVIVPYLKARGIGRLDALMISHSDADHSGGARSVLAALPVGWVSTSLPLDHAVVAAAADHRRCLAGDAWTWDGVRFELLHPVPAVYESTKFKPNAHSCTVKITAGDESILLAGDIEATQEAELVERDAAALRADVLLAPHHGSGTSSTLPFLEAVQPRIAVFQIGYRNRYHHPKQEIYARYADLGIERLRSDDAGAIALQLGDGVRAREYRREHARYWYGR